MRSIERSFRRDSLGSYFESHVLAGMDAYRTVATITSWNKTSPRELSAPRVCDEAATVCASRL